MNLHWKSLLDLFDMALCFPIGSKRKLLKWLQHKLCSDTRPPTQMGYLLFRAAELKRFQSHPFKCTRCLNNAGWEGGLSKLRAGSFLTEWQPARDPHARPYPSHPPNHCQFVYFTPLRSVRHHKLCSDTRPPTQMGYLLFRAAELKRFQSHPFVQQLNPVTSKN